MQTVEHLPIKIPQGTKLMHSVDDITSESYRCLAQCYEKILQPRVTLTFW